MQTIKKSEKKKDSLIPNLSGNRLEQKGIPLSLSKAVTGDCEETLIVYIRIYGEPDRDETL